MVKFLMRFHDLDDGATYIDGYNIADCPEGFTLGTEYGFAGTAFQRTIMENIRYGNLNASDEEVVKAAKAAQVDHFVRTLPAAIRWL